jgi:hypothetical protein
MLRKAGKVWPSIAMRSAQMLDGVTGDGLYDQGASGRLAPQLVKDARREAPLLSRRHNAPMGFQDRWQPRRRLVIKGRKHHHVRLKVVVAIAPV